MVEGAARFSAVQSKRIYHSAPVQVKSISVAAQLALCGMYRLALHTTFFVFTRRNISAQTKRLKEELQSLIEALICECICVGVGGAHTHRPTFRCILYHICHSVDEHIKN